MKKAACAVLIFTMIIFLVNPLSSDAGGYYGSGGGHWGGGYSGHRGGGYGWWLPWAIIGGTVALVSTSVALVSNSVALVSNSVALASNSIAPAPNYYSPYYAPAPVVIREQPQVYVQPAPSRPQPSAERAFVYARQGQSEELQAKDRYECHRWAVSQARYDPTHPANIPQAWLNQVRADYQRAMGACLESHGAVAIDYHEEDTPLHLTTDTIR
jgi:hypothetical protein